MRKHIFCGDWKKTNYNGKKLQHNKFLYLNHEIIKMALLNEKKKQFWGINGTNDSEQPLHFTRWLSSKLPILVQ